MISRAEVGAIGAEIKFNDIKGLGVGAVGAALHRLASVAPSSTAQ